METSVPPKSSAVFPGWAQYPAALDLLVNQISPTFPSGNAAIVCTNQHKDEVQGVDKDSERDRQRGREGERETLGSERVLGNPRWLMRTFHRGLKTGTNKEQRGLMVNYLAGAFVYGNVTFSFTNQLSEENSQRNRRDETKQRREKSPTIKTLLCVYKRETNRTAKS